MNPKTQREDLGPSPASGPGAPDSASPASIEELHAYIRALERRQAEELRQFVYAVSHDLREPARMIVSYAQLLQRRYEAQLGQDGSEFIGYISGAVQRMEQLLGDLLNYSRQLGLPDEPVTTVESELALEGALSSLDASIQESGAQITHDPLPQVLFEFERLTQLFRQLISNSIKFRGDQPPRIHVSASDSTGQVVFAVRDNGLGIDPQYHEQIFGPFKRLHGREYSGTGLGLAICRRIVERHGGRIWVESESGNGATFRFCLPK
ncbi:MAG TPA: ATP-binding protein [Bryobacteraceae bacterium]|nr:ATP-binding protein [Bryobacteraceae bacterium]